MPRHVARLVSVSIQLALSHMTHDTSVRMCHVCVDRSAHASYVVDSLLSYNGATSHVAVSHQTGVCVIVNKQIQNGGKDVE